MQMPKQKQMDGDTYIEKVSTMALCSLTSQIVSQTTKVIQKQSNGRCSWVCIMTALRVPIIIVAYMCGVIYIHVWASALLDLE